MVVDWPPWTVSEVMSTPPGPLMVSEWVALPLLTTVMVYVPALTCGCDRVIEKSASVAVTVVAAVSDPLAGAPADALPAAPALVPADVLAGDAPAPADEPPLPQAARARASAMARARAAGAAAGRVTVRRAGTGASRCGSGTCVSGGTERGASWFTVGPDRPRRVPSGCRPRCGGSVTREHVLEGRHRVGERVGRLGRGRPAGQRVGQLRGGPVDPVGQGRVPA